MAAATSTAWPASSTRCSPASRLSPGRQPRRSLRSGCSSAPPSISLVRPGLPPHVTGSADPGTGPGTGRSLPRPPARLPRPSRTAWPRHPQSRCQLLITSAAAGAGRWRRRACCWSSALACVHLGRGRTAAAATRAAPDSAAIELHAASRPRLRPADARLGSSVRWSSTRRRLRAIPSYAPAWNGLAQRYVFAPTCWAFTDSRCAARQPAQIGPAGQRRSLHGRQRPRQYVGDACSRHATGNAILARGCVPGGAPRPQRSIQLNAGCMARVCRRRSPSPTASRRR